MGNSISMDGCTNFAVDSPQDDENETLGDGVNAQTTIAGKPQGNVRHSRSCSQDELEQPIVINSDESSSESAEIEKAVFQDSSNTQNTSFLQSITNKFDETPASSSRASSQMVDIQKMEFRGSNKPKAQFTPVYHFAALLPENSPEKYCLHLRLILLRSSGIANIKEIRKETKTAVLEIFDKKIGITNGYTPSKQTETIPLLRIFHKGFKMRYDENVDAWFCEEDLTKYLPVDKHAKLSSPFKHTPPVIKKVEETTKESEISSEWKSARAKKKSAKLRESEESEALVQEEQLEEPPAKKPRIPMNLSLDDEMEDKTRKMEDIASNEMPLFAKKITARKRAPTSTPPSKVQTIVTLPVSISPVEKRKEVKKPKEKVSKYFEKSPKTKVVRFLSRKTDNHRGMNF